MHDSNVSGFNAFGLSVSTAFAAKTSFDNHLLKNLFSNQRTTSTSKYNHLSSTSLVTKEDEEKEAEQMQLAIDNKDFLK